MHILTDVKRRFQLAWAAIHKLKNVFAIANGPLKKLAYKSLIFPILIYNCEQWTLDKRQLKRVDIQQRRIMRYILNIHYPDIISNKNLYRFFQAFPLSKIVEMKTLLTFAHLIRRPKDTPFQLALDASADTQYHYWVTNANKLTGKVVDKHGKEATMEAMRNKQKWAEMIVQTFH